MKFGLENKITVVTGGAQGIGRAICQTLAQEGANVVVADINPSANETVEMIRNTGREAMFVNTNVADEETVKQLYETVLTKFGTIDVLVNNAGICKMISILDITVEEWDKILAVNLRYS